ncbi:MAG: GNAT family N-acetyltransferase [Gammaproteobacteria bacterium]|nr:GNAT family N-acetyltransferase [Gammaproteobacteria bacterium]
MIESINNKNLNEALPLIRKYQEYYEVTNIDDEKNREFFSQFGPLSDKGCLFGHRKNGQLVAFATVYFSYASSIISKVAIMNDLYTLKEYRNLGIGTELIKHCEKYARENGAVRLQWVTASGNKIAQSIYKNLGAKQSSWEFFTYTT